MTFFFIFYFFLWIFWIFFNPILDTRISGLCPSVRNAQTTPLDSETGGLESSGQRLVSSIDKSKGKAFSFLFQREKKYFQTSDFWRKKWFFEKFEFFFLIIDIIFFYFFLIFCYGFLGFLWDFVFNFRFFENFEIFFVFFSKFLLRLLLNTKNGLE